MNPASLLMPAGDALAMATGPKERPHLVEPIVAVVGLGYVGLPLAVAFGRDLPTIGIDVDAAHVAALAAGQSTLVSASDLHAARRATYATDCRELSRADFIVVAVPTPVAGANRPDLRPLKEASRSIGQHMKRGATVVFESTVYPGATEEICIPALEAASGMRWQHDFHVGYSPERVNPGDDGHDVRSVRKVVGGDSPETTERLARLYGRVVRAGVFRAASIKAAEAAKVLENTQRDVNIALINEAAMLFDRLGIDTADVLAAASTKWNFAPYSPGLVGGHCIGVDPYYLTFKAQTVGLDPALMLAARKVNDGMGVYLAHATLKELVARDGRAAAPRVNVLGITFKEDIDDARNSRVVDIVRELAAFGAQVHVHDPHANAAWVRDEYGIDLVAESALPPADALVLAVAHRDFLDMPFERLARSLKPGGLLVDVKSRLPRATITSAGFEYWRL